MVCRISLLLPTICLLYPDSLFTFTCLHLDPFELELIELHWDGSSTDEKFKDTSSFWFPFGRLIEYPLRMLEAFFRIFCQTGLCGFCIFSRFISVSVSESSLNMLLDWTIGGEIRCLDEEFNSESASPISYWMFILFSDPSWGCAMYLKLAFFWFTTVNLGLFLDLPCWADELL